MRILTKVHQTRRTLVCETCGDSKRSVVGFISHLQCCQKSVEVGTLTPFLFTYYIVILHFHSIFSSVL